MNESAVQARAQTLAHEELVAAGGALRVEDLVARLLVRAEDDASLRDYVHGLGLLD
jgi:hypothetical protein